MDSYLAPSTPCATWDPILRDRRAACDHDVAQGLRRFVSFDDGPAYALHALAAVGEVWPPAVCGSSSPPCQTPSASRLHHSVEMLSLSCRTLLTEDGIVGKCFHATILIIGSLTSVLHTHKQKYLLLLLRSLGHSKNRMLTAADTMRTSSLCDKLRILAL